jgi:ABC-type branched-subunit amino acid transport system substrate-binding protein
VGDAEGDQAPSQAQAQSRPFRVAVVGGDPVEQAGFNAYVSLLNQHGGAAGRRFDLVGADDPADAIVNVSGTPFARAPRAIALDSFLGPESSLLGAMFAFGGVPERQAHLIVDAVFPAPSTARAAVYQEAGGPLGTTVPDAMRAVLQARGVTVVTVTVQPDRPMAPVPVDAVFLSLDAPHAEAVIAAYGQMPPSMGFNGIGTLADVEVVKRLPDNVVRFVSPYALPDSAEGRALSARAGRALSARLIHGWVAAKSLAVAVWRENPQSPAALQTALRNLAGYANGFAPAYAFRGQTNSVQPEGALFTVRNHAPAQSGDFRTDPH